MKKAVFLLILFSLIACALIIGAFLFIDVSGHWSVKYKVYFQDNEFGEVKVDRYRTENRIVFKSAAEYPHTAGYPKVSEKLTLLKSSMTPLKFEQKSQGVKGQKKVITLVQKGEESDYLFLEHPKFIRLEGFSTGEKTMVFLPDDIMLLTPIMERYNYWRKGAQFFEVMMPTSEPIPPMRDKMEVRFIREEYITVMGRRVEADRFLVKASSLPDMDVTVSRYSHRILEVNVNKLQTRFVLASTKEGLSEKIDSLMSKLKYVSNLLKGKSEPKREKIEEKPLDEVAPPEKQPGKALEPSPSGREVFFDSEGLILCGKVFAPLEEGPHPAALILPGEGPRKRGEELFVEELSRHLVSSGFLVLYYDNPGQGKSQGSFNDLDDEMKISVALSALKYLEELEEVNKEAVSIIGHKGSAYLALNAAIQDKNASACVMLSPEMKVIWKKFLNEPSGEELQKHLKRKGYGPFESNFLRTVALRVQKQLEHVTGSSEKFVIFLGEKI